jgi:hypothetical protein
MADGGNKKPVAIKALRCDHQRLWPELPTFEMSSFFMTAPKAHGIYHAACWGTCHRFSTVKGKIEAWKAAQCVVDGRRPQHQKRTSAP